MHYIQKNKLRLTLNIFEKYDNGKGKIDIKYLPTIIKGIGIDISNNSMKKRINQFNESKSDKMFNFVEFLEKFGYLYEENNIIKNAIIKLKGENSSCIIKYI